MSLCDFENIIKNNKKEIVEMALENVNENFDSVVQLDVREGKLYKATMSSNEVENPLNNVVEVYRLEQGFDCEEVAGCFYCDSLCTCDNDEEFQLECACDNLVEDFELCLDDILSSVSCQIQENGFDLI